jgi:hypothetical protein
LAHSVGVVIVALRFVIDLTGGMEWRDLALGLFESPIFFLFCSARPLSPFVRSSTLCLDSWHSGARSWLTRVVLLVLSSMFLVEVINQFEI